MSIVGVGTDVVAQARIEAVHQRFGQRFARRLLTPEERRQRVWTSEALARRWALKEAVAKALGTGIGGLVGFQEIHTDHLPGGMPMVRVDGYADHVFHVSVSDDAVAGVSVAFCTVVRA